ncbi:hypothetical protein MTP03_25710 [Tsukamurella sp. PLM1]|nr:hypothetical protein MTP03_25710 [Tsukamurella sp. PLM1]
MPARAVGVLARTRMPAPRCIPNDRIDARTAVKSSGPWPTTRSARTTWASVGGVPAVAPTSG